MSSKSILKIKQKFFTLLSKFFSFIFPLQPNKVLIISDARAKLGGNLEYVYNEIKDKNYDIIISLRAIRTDKPNRRNFTEEFKLLYHLSTSKYILLDDVVRAVSLMHVRKGQKICQLWHGAGAFKTFGYSRNDREIKNEEHIFHNKYTNTIVSSEEIRDCYAEGFGISKDKVKATGIPRTDIFFNKEYQENTRKELYKKYPYPKNKKVILFAPTYRGESLTKCTYDYDSLNYEELYKELKNDYIFIFKWHLGIYWKIGDSLQIHLIKYNNFFVDFSSERDINDLLLIADVVITDYSSVIFDYALLKKPIIYFVYDLYNYLVERGLYFPFEDYTYGPITKNTNELITAIKSLSLDKKKHAAFVKKFMSACDGNSTKKTVKWIFGDK